MEPEPDATQPEPREASPVEAVVVGLVLVGVLVGGVWWMNSVERAGPASRTCRAYAQYVGEKVCRECHPGVTAQHARSGHSRTLRPAKDVPIAAKLDGRAGDDPERPGTTFSYRFRDGVLSATRTSPEAGAEKLLLQYALGSGHHATTFVTLNDGGTAESGSVEHRLTCFAEGGDFHFGITPGQNDASVVSRGVKTPQGRALNAEQTMKCFDCHSTVLSDRGAGALDAAKMMPNVSCERCHGPAKAHVEAARRGDVELKMPFGEGRESPAAEMKLCGHCHRLPEMAPPGAVRPDNPELARFQPVSLIQSACFKGTNETLRCTTCHDPHTRSSTDIPAYEAKCLSCHGSGAKTSCSVSPKNGCVGCHMPKRDSGQGILFTDHWIKIVPAEGPKPGG